MTSGGEGPLLGTDFEINGVAEFFTQNWLKLLAMIKRVKIIF